MTKSQGCDASSAASPSLFARAAAHHGAGRLGQAEQLYREVLAADPDNARCLALFGMLARQTERLDLAAACLQRAIALDPNEVNSFCALASVRLAQGQLAEAANCYHRAVALQPKLVEAHVNLGLTLAALGQIDDAVACYHAALACRPDHPEALVHLGLALARKGRPDLAANAYQAALAYQPDCTTAASNLTATLPALDAAQAAGVCSDLGAACLKQERLDEGVAWMRRAVELNPELPEAVNNLGAGLREQMKLDEAICWLRRAVTLWPEYAEAHLNLGIALLAKGAYSAGWREYEWRWQTTVMRPVRRAFDCPQWRGEAADGRTLLLHAEQGFGDTLQFCRYATLAAARGWSVVMEVQRPLVRLLRSLAGTAHVLPHGDTLPPFDMHCPMLSLPLAMDTTLATVPVTASYLRADGAAVARWARRLHATAHRSLRVGVVWAGGASGQTSDAVPYDRRRSLAPNQLRAVLATPGVRFFSLQKHGPAPPADLPLQDFMHEMDDFADTAALVANLDLVISVDTAMVHLAGSLGVPVWLLDRFDACWRWLDGRRDSPWYPSLRIYRQPTAGAWDDVIHAVAADLRALAQDSSYGRATLRPALEDLTA